MIRKTYLSFLMPVLLLLAQQGAVLHELGHIAPESQRMQGRNQQPDPQQLPGPACEKCVVFAHLSGAVAPDVPSIDVQPPPHVTPVGTIAALRSADTPAARNRGPPVIL